MTALDARGCLDDNEVTAFVARRMPAEARARVMAHLDGCELCLAITSAAARSTDHVASDVAAPAGGDARGARDVAGAPAGGDARDARRRAQMAVTVDGDAPQDAAGAATTGPDAATDATVPLGGAAPLRLPRGQRIAGRYTLVSMIGEGAMGVVYVADDPQLDRKVALKLVRSGRFAHGDARARLSREARAMARVKHPNVVTVYDAGELDDGVFIAMELVTGTTLADWLARPRAWRDIVRVFEAAGRGLVAAHAAGIVHRDFKPENVLVDRDDRACVTDFGLAFAPAGAVVLPAELADVRLHEAGALTRTGALVGTPLYMSPEQHRAERVDARSDQYSFAVALYLALYGVAPFGGSTVGEVRAAVLDGRAPPRPGGSQVPVCVHRVLSRALAARPDARYPSVERMLAELTLAARPAWWRRKRAAALGAGVLAVAAAGAATLAMVPAGGPAPVASHAVVPMLSATTKGRRVVMMIDRVDNHSGDPRLDGAAELQLVAVLARSTKIDALTGSELRQRVIELTGKDGTLDATGRAVTARDGNAAIILTGSIEPGEPGPAITSNPGSGHPGLIVSVTVLDTAAVMRPFTLREPAATADDVLPAAVRLAQAVRSRLGEDTAHDSARALSGSLDAVHELLAGKRLSEAGQTTDARGHLLRAIAADPGLSLAHVQLGNVLYNLSHTSEAAVELERALQDRDRMPERMRLAVLGDYLDSSGRYLESVAAYEQLLAKWPGDVRTEINVVSSAVDGTSWPLALELARRAATDHGNIPVTRANLLLAELANGRLTDAVHDGTVMVDELPRPTPFGVTFLMIAHALTGDLAAAEQAVVRLATIDPGFADDARIDLRMFEGRLADAEAILRGEIAQVANGAQGDLRFVMTGLAMIQLRRGDAAAARRSAAQATGIPTVRNAYIAASVLCAAGDDHVARQLARDWATNPLAEWRMFGKLLDGDVARAHRDPRAAIVAYREAARLGDAWILHARLGLAQLAAGAFAEAIQELAGCITRRGEAAVFLSPSMSLLPEVYLGLAKAKEGAHDPGALTAYRDVVALAPDAQGDPITELARTRAAALAPRAP